MVEVKYSSQMGNHLFQYCFGRIIAERLGYKLKAGPIPGFSNTAKKVNGHDYFSYPADLLLGHIEKKIKRQEIDLKALLADKRKRKIVINGFFQRYEYYKPYKSQIRMIGSGSISLLKNIPIRMISFSMFEGATM